MKAKIPQPPDALHASLADAEAFLAWARGDLERLITKLALPYVDDSNPILHLDELRAELWARVTRILHSGRLACCPTRQKTFGYLKASLGNHLFSLIQKHVFTSKRNGWTRARGRAAGRNGKTPSRPEKPVRVGLDDPEAHLQLGVLDNAGQTKELIEEVEYRLLPGERRVLHQLIEPNRLAQELWLAEAPGGWRNAAIPNRHLAAGLGISEGDFKRIVQRIRTAAWQSGIGPWRERTALAQPGEGSLRPLGSGSPGLKPPPGPVDMPRAAA